MAEIFDILAFVLYCLCFAAAGIGLIESMQTRSDILGFIPPLIEKKLTPMHPLYKLVTCAKCASGQVAFWAGLFVCPHWDLITRIGAIFVTSWLAKLLTKLIEWLGKG